MAQQPPSTSASLTVELVGLNERKLDAAAGRLGTDEFVGAMYFPAARLWC